MKLLDLGAARDKKPSGINNAYQLSIFRRSIDTP